ncbi:MAG: branched-chain amino acid ABC transporter permease, partial [Thermodesulfobacteriota bacterium]
MLELILTQLLNGVTVGLILALVALGLTLVLGLMEVVNFAHGSFYMLGGYITFTVTSFLGNFWLGLAAGGLVAAL